VKKIHALEASVIIAMKDFHRDFGPDYKAAKQRRKRWA
jgi:hypothetical protein